MTKVRTFIICLIAAIVISILCFMLTGCKTRKIERNQTSVQKTEQHDQASSVNKTVTDILRSEITSEAGNFYTSQMDNEGSIIFSADSVKQVEESDQATGKTISSTIFYTGGKMVNIRKKNTGITTGIKFFNSTGSRQQDHREISDVSTVVSKTTKQDSLSKEKKVQTEGSGKRWPLITGLVATLGLILYFIYKKGLKMT